MNYYLKDATESISQWLLNDSGEMEHSKIKKALDFMFGGKVLKENTYLLLKLEVLSFKMPSFQHFQVFERELSLVSRAPSRE